MGSEDTDKIAPDSIDTPANTAVRSEKLSQSTPLLKGTPTSELNEYPLIQEALLNEKDLYLQAGNRSGVYPVNGYASEGYRFGTSWLVSWNMAI